MFTRQDLLNVVSERELTALATRLAAADGSVTDPTADAISRAQATVERYAARYTLDADTQKGFTGDLTLYFLAVGAGADVPAKRQAAYEQTMSELRDIRDGKYLDLPLKEPPTSDAHPPAGRSGGAPDILPRR